MAHEIATLISQRGGHGRQSTCGTDQLWILRNEKLDPFDEHKGLILGDAKINDQWSDDDSAHLHSQTRKAICRLASLQRMKLQVADDLTKSPRHSRASALERSLTMDSADGIGEST